MDSHYSDLDEELVLFFSVLKWVALASLVGVLVGFSTAFFLAVLKFSVSLTSSIPYYYFLLPVALPLSVFLVTKFAPQAEGHGTEKVIEAFHRNEGIIPANVVPVKLFATIATIAFGGSAGKEGPCAQIGAGIASFFAQFFHFDENDRKKLVICGISAGFASVFGTPIAGAIFGVEVLFAGSILYSALLPSFVAGLISYHIAKTLGVSYLSAVSITPMSFGHAIYLDTILAGIFFGLCSFMLIELLWLGKRLSKRLGPNVYRRAFIGGLILSLFGLMISPTYLGLGFETISSAMAGNQVNEFAFVLKSISTSITLGFGGSGGILAPIFFIGSTAGVFFANHLNLDVAMFAGIGLVSVLAGATNAPIAASIMAIELFGSAVAPYAALSCIISFLITGHRSVYPSQLLSISKSPSLEVTGKDLSEKVSVKVKPRRFTIMSVIGWLGQRSSLALKKIFPRQARRRKG